MSQNTADPKVAFLEVLKEYDKTLADSKPAIFLGAALINKMDSKVNFITNTIGFIVGVFTSRVHYTTTDPETGNVALASDGVYFFATEGEKITHHYFFPFNKMSKAVMGRDIVMTKQLSISGVYSPSGREEGYTLSFDPGKESSEEFRT